jgi:hypothetical protein
MKKESLKRVIDIMPGVLNNLASWIKDNYEDNAQDIIKNASGSVGLVLKLIGTPLLNKYYDNLSTKRLDDFGFNTYLKAAYSQASNSIATIEDEIKSKSTPEEIIETFSNITIGEIERLKSDELIVLFQPQYHPAVVQIMKNYVTLLHNLEITQVLINQFVKDFNENIIEEVETTFGDDYKKHLEEIEGFLTEKNESDLLWDTIKNGRIGFESGEDLKYETAYGNWKEVSKFNTEEKEEDISVEKEETLQPVTKLIDEYFSVCPENNLEKILFIVADFGKGKSVFMRKYASELAKLYIDTKSGYFPIYFNLRNYSNYQQETKLGVISDYLLTRYGINIDTEYYRSKKFIFLIDSLDESGELNKSSIDKVIGSVKQIQQLDKTKYRTNKIIITTRPFPEGLQYQLRAHAPFCKQNKDKREVEYFISLYGFKRDQFNDWLYTSLQSIKGSITKDRVDFVSKIYNKINIGENIDIHALLLKNKTLTASELRRPIFGYMIYQLIINNIDFLKVGKIGVYLSFLNLLTKEAKHIKDPSYKVSLKEEFEFRNLLHTTSALWMFERHKGNQGFLKKADLCRVLDGIDKKETDNQIIDRYKKQDIVEIEFLSHSYFGENNNTLHFQHQSFAEILLAEYYLKVFIKYALDEDSGIEEARSKLILGEPTDQTINFLKELLQLLKETAQENTSDSINEKRKLLFPLLASISTKKNNSLFSNDVYYEWFKRFKLDENQSSYPIESLDNWYFNEKKILEIVKLAQDILDSRNTFILASAETKSSLYNNELLLIQNEKLTSLTHDIDKWLSLLVGNTLYNDFSSTENPKLFNYDYKTDPNILFELIKVYELSTSSRNYDSNWKQKLFKGIDMRQTKTKTRFFSVLNNFDFSYSILQNIDFSGCLFGNTNFDHCGFFNIDFSHSYFWDPNLNNISGMQSCKFNHIVVSDILISNILPNSFHKNERDLSPVFIPTMQNEEHLYRTLNSIIAIINPIISYSGESDENMMDCIPKFIFESKELEEKFLKSLLTGDKILPPITKHSV